MKTTKSLIIPIHTAVRILFLVGKSEQGWAAPFPISSIDGNIVRGWWRSPVTAQKMQSKCSKRTSGAEPRRAHEKQTRSKSRAIPMQSNTDAEHMMSTWWAHDEHTKIKHREEAEQSKIKISSKSDQSQYKSVKQRKSRATQTKHGGANVDNAKSSYIKPQLISQPAITP